MFGWLHNIRSTILRGAVSADISPQKVDKLAATVMAPNRKKRRPINNPSRGFATVSTTSKKVDESRLQGQDRAEETSANGKLPDVEAKQEKDVAFGGEPSDLQHMSPEELEQHLEESGLQALLDCHGQRCKKDILRQAARLETERRSLRQGGIVLETESWLPEVQEEILELAKSSSPGLRALKSVEKRPDDTDLYIRLWTIQQTLLCLRFRRVDGVLKRLLKTFYAHSNNDSLSLICALDDAISWLALHADPGDLPAYQKQMHPQVSPPASRDQSPVSAHASGEIINTSKFPIPHLCGYLPFVDDNEPNISSKLTSSESPTKNNTSYTNSTTTVSDDSDDDDDDPDQLADKFLSAKYELLKCSLSGKLDQQESSATSQQAQRLKGRIQKIERDVLFNRNEAMARWDHVKRDLEIEHARSNRGARRQSRPKDALSSTDTSDGDVGSRKVEAKVNDDAIEEELFGSMFALDEKSGDDGDAAPAPNITLRNYGPVGGGGIPRKVLEDICKAR